MIPYKWYLTVFFLTLVSLAHSQKLVDKRVSIYTFLGTSGAELHQLNDFLGDRGLSPYRNRYYSYGLGYQNRINDFILGVELSQHQSKTSSFDEFDLKYRTSRALLSIGYAMTEEGKFQLIHYMSLGVGYLNFEMLPSNTPKDLETFLDNPKNGFVLRENNIHKGTRYYGDFLTEIGFQLSYDFDLPGREEALIVMARMGYSFSPFEDKWNLGGISFKEAQSGAYFRVGAGISLPDRNFFYKDASIGISIVKGFYFSEPDKLNQVLKRQGYFPLDGVPSNLGIRILGETSGLLYGADIFNLAMSGKASGTQSHSLNSLRVYGNVGIKPIQYKNISLGLMWGLGLGNIRYTLSQDSKPDFPTLFEQRYFDGYLKNSGLMAKPELFLEYGLPITKRKLFDLLFTASGGYELALSNYRLGDMPMARYMSGPYVMLGVGVRP